MDPTRDREKFEIKKLFPEIILPERNEITNLLLANLTEEYKTEVDDKKL